MTHAQLEDASGAANGALFFDALHVPANREGGERGWCDAFAVDDERYAFAIGEVAGDASAVALMTAAFRDAFGAEASSEPGPAPGLWAGPAGAGPTPAALVGIVDSRGATLSYSSAGQPPPCIRYHDGSVAVLPAGPPAGVSGEGLAPAQVVVDLRGAAMVLFSANALVRTAADGDDGVRTVRRALETARPEHWARPAAALADALIGGKPHDDLVLLVVSFAPDAMPHDPSGAAPGATPRWSVTWSFDTTHVAATGVRRAFMAYLASKESAAPIDLDAAELIFGEMLGNVIRHAAGPVEITLDWTGELPLLHMLDDGPGFASRRSRERLPNDDWSESGRGLFIINACAGAFSLRNRSGRRGTHACATLRAA